MVFSVGNGRIGYIGADDFRQYIDVLYEGSIMRHVAIAIEDGISGRVFTTEVDPENDLPAREGFLRESQDEFAIGGKVPDVRFPYYMLIGRVEIRLKDDVTRWAKSLYDDLRSGKFPVLENPSREYQDS